jgi:hypothetical protein
MYIMWYSSLVSLEFCIVCLVVMAGNALSRLVNNNLETTVIIFLSYETLRAFHVRTLTQESFLYMQITE